jgi:hypothetical protein
VTGTACSFVTAGEKNDASNMFSYILNIRTLCVQSPKTEAGAA